MIFFLNINLIGMIFCNFHLTKFNTMKNLLLAGIIGVSLTAASCAGVKNAQNSQSLKKEFLQLKGDWQITSVDYDKNFKVKPFDEGADAQCFVGSTWKLVPNNYTGTYSINGGGDCPSVVQPIKFEVVNGNQFQFKKLIAGSKAKAVTTGYALSLVGQTADTFTLEQNIPSDGENVRIVYNFSKLSN